MLHAIIHSTYKYGKESFVKLTYETLLEVANKLELSDDEKEEAEE